MKKMNSLLLLETLIEQTREIILKSEKLKHTPLVALEQNPAPGKWSAVQVLEHLNIYCRYYLPLIEKELNNGKKTVSDTFTPGWLGNYFTNLMRPGGDGKIKSRMRAPSSALPSDCPAGKAELETFIGYQHQLLQLLQAAKLYDLNRIRIPVSIARFIRLKLGDTFRFIVAHQQRHFIQINNAVSIVQHSMAPQLPVMP